MTMPSREAGLEDAFFDWGLLDGLSALEGRTQENVVATLQATVGDLPVAGSESGIGEVQDYFGNLTVGLGDVIEDIEELQGDVAALEETALPDQAGHGGEWLSTDGSDAAWATITAGAVSGFDAAADARVAAAASDYATAAQGTTADNAVQPGDTLFIQDGSEPDTPTGGGVLYVDSGSLKYKGSSGTVTTLGVA